MSKQAKRLSLVLSTVLVFTGLALAQEHEHEHGGALEARQHGYEHGYRDGYHHGREDRARGTGYNYKTKDYERGDVGYERYVGDHDKYKDGYREGYQGGYDDAYRGHPARFREIYGIGSRANPDEAYPEDRSDDVYVTHGYGVADVAYDFGYRDGLEAGLSDHNQNRAFNAEAHSRYQDALHGYRDSYGDREAYQRIYRQAYSIGYKDGFGR
jgi:hypothetical protein